MGLIFISHELCHFPHDNFMVTTIQERVHLTDDVPHGFFKKRWVCNVVGICADIFPQGFGTLLCGGGEVIGQSVLVA